MELSSLDTQELDHHEVVAAGGGGGGGGIVPPLQLKVTNLEHSNRNVTLSPRSPSPPMSPKTVVRRFHEKQKEEYEELLIVKREKSCCTISIRMLLGISVLLVIASNAALVWIGVVSTESSTKSVTLTLRQSLEHTVSIGVEAFMTSPLGVVSHLSSMIARGYVDVRDMNVMHMRLFENMEVAPASAYYFGLEDLTFTGYFQLNATHMSVREMKTNEPKRTLYVVKKTDPFTLDPNVLLQPSAFYNTTARPWYMEAKANRVTLPVRYSSVYFFVLDLTPGITATSCIFSPQGEFLGVAAVDLSLNFLNNMLQQMNPGRGTITYITESGGMLIATSHGPSGSSNARLHAVNSSEVLIRESVARVTWDNNQRRDTFTIDNMNYWLDVVPLSIPTVNWYYIGVMSEDAYMHEAAVARTQLIIITTVVATSALALSIFTVIALSRPLRDLQEGMTRVADMDFNLYAKEQHGTFVREIDQMSHTYHSMVVALYSFAKFVPTAVIKNMMVSKEPASLGLKPAASSVFFLDIADFTHICEVLRVDDLVSLMAEVFEATSAIVSMNWGTIDKYIGDSLMAFWNAPVAVADYEYLSAKAAWECVKGVETMSKQWLEQYDVTIKIRIGIQSGNVHVGNFGSRSKLNYTVIGDVVNQASRFEGLNKKYGTNILVGKDVAMACHGRIIVRRLDSVCVKGKEKPVDVFDILGADMNDLAALELKRVYEEAHDQYEKELFVEAMNTLGSVLDTACATLHQRCSELVSSPEEAKKFNSVLLLDYK